MSQAANFDLSGKTAIVTGASKGLGAAIAIGLAQSGADVALVARGDLSETRAGVEKAGRKAFEIPADLCNREETRQVLPRIREAIGGEPDILVNNAGTIRRADFLDFSEKDWDEVLELNLTSLFLLSQEFARGVVKAGKPGKIIQIASMLSYQGGIRVPSYTASKSAVMGLTRLMANELAPHQINVNAIAPGYMATENTAPLRADEARNKAILDRIPAGRWGDPTDIVGPTVFLASAASNYLQGYTIAVDGGWLAR
ncbi:MAG: 2-dehydro-3-deoxy-D-gluconate 5-dehydrogenase KduD [Verrucomicrobiota bacterium JB022]|nr:2-dehydro-3-deoxy-D-gluconate 5-dehydrogenase KduD [Verrucomicrobiota bacterium JB022]